MVRKIRKTTDRKTARDGDDGSMDKHLAANIRDSAQQIWLAGMGAFGRAQAEGGKVFESLMSEGLNLQRRTQGMAEDKIHEMAGRMTSMAGDVQSRAGQHWDKLESIFENRTAKAMARLGVPTAKDVDALIKRVDELAAAVARLSGQPAPAAPRAPRRRAAGTTTKVSAPTKGADTAAQAKLAKKPAARKAVAR